MKICFSFQIILLLFGFSFLWWSLFPHSHHPYTRENTVHQSATLTKPELFAKMCDNKVRTNSIFWIKNVFFCFLIEWQVHLATMACRGSYSFPYLAKRNSTHKKIFLLNSNLTLERFEEFQNKISLLANKEQLSLRNSLVLGNSGKRRIFKRC